MKWSALHDAAATVALLAGIEAKTMTQEVRAFPVSLRDAQPDAREAVENGDIPLSRYQSYLRLYDEAKQLNDWEL